MNRSFAWASVLVLSSVACSRTLSKDDAKQQLTAWLKDRNPIYCELGYETLVVLTPYTGFGSRSKTGVALHLDPNSECMNQLVESGFAQPGLLEEQHKGADLKAILAKDYRAKVKQTAGSDSGKLLLACAAYELDELKGVTTEGKHAVASYTVKARPDAQIKTLTKCGVIGQPQTGRLDYEAKFRQDDDGHWSIDEK